MTLQPSTSHVPEVEGFDWDEVAHIYDQFDENNAPSGPALCGYIRQRIGPLITGNFTLCVICKALNIYATKL